LSALIQEQHRTSSALGAVQHRYLTVVEDQTTERKRAEEADRLLASERVRAEMLREADTRKDEFLAVLAHELRNPLAPITMVLEVLRQRESNDEHVRWARELIGRQVGQLTRLVEDLLDISRIAGGKIQLHMDNIDVREVIQTAVETSQPNLLARQIDFHLELDRAPLLVCGDAARIAQLVSNLLNNAAKYTPSGGRVDLSAFREDAEVVVRCADEGAGIPAHMLARVFEPFMQADRSRDAKLGGLGLGLALVKRLVEIHGGTVQAQSDGPGTGSQFVVRMPCLQATANERSDLRIDVDSVPTSSGVRQVS
jgi:signal transduction histidine kinase